MNNMPTSFAIMNPLQKTIEESETIILQMQEASDDLQTAIADERGWYEAYRKLLEVYEAAETEELAEVIVMAQQKEGPLAGIAVSGKGYEIALNNLKNNLRNGTLAHLWDKAENARRSYQQAQVALQQAETRFNALRKICDLKTQVLRASTI
jgi:hypothetical protein